MSRVEPNTKRLLRTDVCRILVVDDEPLLLRSIQRMLKQHDVTAVLGGRDALTLLSRDQDFCVILCDLSMPGIDGLGVHDFLLRNAPSLIPRTIFMSGSPVGFEWFGTPGPQTLNKPFELQSLRQLVEKTCRQNGPHCKTFGAAGM